MSFHYGSTSTADQFSDNNYPTVRVNLDDEMFSRLFGHRERLIALCREAPAPVSLTFNSCAEFGRLTLPYRDGMTESEEAALDSGDLLRLPPNDDYPDEFAPTTRGGEQTEVVSKSGVEFVWTPEYGRGSSFRVPWADLEVLYSDRPCPFPVSENVRALATGILAEGATDRMPILADALDECGAPPWIGRGMREDRDWSSGWLHLLNVYEDRRPTVTKTPFFRSLAGLVPHEPADELPDDGGAGMATCRECGEPCFVGPDGVSNHVDEAGETDYDLDENHVAVPEEEEADVA